MDWRLRLIRTEFGCVGRREIEKIREALKIREDDIQRLLYNSEYILEYWNEDLAREISTLLWGICELYSDCDICPVNQVCRFAKDCPSEIFLCENCPHLRKCVANRDRRLLAYIQFGESL
jgi:hypothetical protein